MERTVRAAALKNPMSNVLWYPGGSFKSNLTLHKIDVVLSHYLPAYFIDFICRLSGKRPIMVNIDP